MLLPAVILAGARSVLPAQPSFSAPVERSAFSHATPYDSLIVFIRNLARAPGVQVDPIATSVEGRAVFAVRAESPGAPEGDSARLTVLLFAQQHGDEPSGKEALTMLLSRCASGRMERVLRKLNLLVVPQMNPDGAVHGRRRTSDGTDLNRNHVLLTSPEVRGLHDLFDAQRPEVTVDVHEYSSSSKDWSDSGFVHSADVQLGMLTNLNTPPAIREIQHSRIFPFIADRMKEAGYSFQEYIVGSPGERIRHSTTEINDGRQSLGILNTVSFIQEGRKWSTLDDHLERRAKSQLASIEALLEFCSVNADKIRSLVRTEREHLASGGPAHIVVKMDHAAGESEMWIPVTMTATGETRMWRIPVYHGIVVPLESVSLPTAYIIPREWTSLLALIDRHHVEKQIVTREMSLDAVQYLVDSSGYEVREEDSIRVVTALENGPVRAGLMPGDVIVRTSQLRGVFLAVLLEPQSMWGVRKYAVFDDLFKERRYPILRVEQQGIPGNP